MGAMVLEYVPLESQVADILTRPLAKGKFQLLRRFGGEHLPHKEGVSFTYCFICVLFQQWHNNDEHIHSSIVSFKAFTAV
jgi:hypothetical protein